MNGKIYCVTDPNGKKYIGETTDDVYICFNNYIDEALCRRLMTPLGKAIHEYGMLTFRLFRVRVLEEGITDKATLYSRKNLYIRNWNTLMPNGYNGKSYGMMSNSDFPYMPLYPVPIHEGGGFYWDTHCIECNDTLFTECCYYQTEFHWREPESCPSCEQRGYDEDAEGIMSMTY